MESSNEGIADTRTQITTVVFLRASEDKSTSSLSPTNPSICKIPLSHCMFVRTGCKSFLLCVFLFVCHSFGGLHGRLSPHVSCSLLVRCLQNALSRSYNPNNSPLSWSHYGSCRDMHASQGSLVFSGRDGQPYGALGFCVSTVNL